MPYEPNVILQACMIAMVCCESVRRKAPTNYIFLGVFTLCEGYLLVSGFWGFTFKSRIHKTFASLASRVPSPLTTRRTPS